MKLPNPEINRAVRQWLDKADKDLRAGYIVLKNDRSLCGVASFHAQQAAEKYLKALLTFHQIPFGKTHDIGLLLELAARGDQSLVDRLRESIVLTDFAVDSRYPGELPEISETQAQETLKLAEMVRDEVSIRLPKDL